MRLAHLAALQVAATAVGASLGQAAAQSTPRSTQSVPPTIEVERLGLIVTPGMDARMGSNIAGPSLIRVPAWIERPLGRYYLYFADHEGTYIRLAYADRVTGPWRMHEPGTLRLDQSHFPTTCPPCASPGERPYAHIASPDVHVDEARHEIVMYVHGQEAGRQVTRAATSSDGIQFVGRPEVLGRPYFRAFRFGGFTYALAMPGWLYRSRDGLTGFEEGPSLFNPQMRHSALLLRGDTLHVFYTQVGEAPERILHSAVRLGEGDWRSWWASEPVEVLRPELSWEGADLPIEPSERGSINVPAHQLRDPAIYEEDGTIWLLYSVAGERGIALARVTLRR